MMKSNRLKLGSLALACFALDQAVKFIVRQSLPTGESVPVIPDVFHITHVHNTGVAFSLLSEHPQWLLALTVILFTGFLVFALSRALYSRLELAGFAMVLGGAAGNIADRVMFGRVIDYIDVIVIRYPVFNLADSFICVGVGLLVLKTLREPHDHHTDVTL